MAAAWLFRVFDAFNVRGNGWVLVPGVARAGPTVAVGDWIELRGGTGPARRARTAWLHHSWRTAIVDSRLSLQWSVMPSREIAG